MNTISNEEVSNALMRSIRDEDIEFPRGQQGLKQYEAKFSYFKNGKLFLVDAKIRVNFSSLAAKMQRQDPRDLRDYQRIDLDSEELGFKVIRSLAQSAEKTSFLFHAMSKGSHYLLSAQIKRDFFEVEVKGYAYKEAREAFPEEFASRDEFISYLRTLSPLELAPAEEESKEDIDLDGWSHKAKGISYSLSNEMKLCLEGKKGVDHRISLDKLEKCIKKLPQRIPKEKLQSDNSYSHPFFDRGENRFFYLIVTFNGQDRMFKTVYYLSDSVFMSQNGLSREKYEFLKGPKSPISKIYFA